MDHSLLMSVADGVADLPEEQEAFLEIELMLIGVGGDLSAADELHHEVGPSVLGEAGIVDLSDSRMCHQSQRLALDVEACESALAAQGAAHQLDRHLALDGFVLLCFEDDAHAAFPEHSKDSVRADLFRTIVQVGSLCVRVDEVQEPLFGLGGAMFQKSLRFEGQRGVLCSSAFENALAFVAVGLGEAMVEGLETLEAVAVAQVGQPALAVLERRSTSHARAKLQSRSVVAMETPRAPAISAVRSPQRRRSLTVSALRSSRL